jgi:cytosine/adenosine deaminase-related metal-dependent hydrolase
MILRARLVLPLSQSPIADGAVEIRGRRIAAVGPWRTMRGEKRRKVVDLGETILLPGLVNAHCHLDYTHMAGQIPPAQSFTEWLKVIVSTKAGWTRADYAASWREGAQMLLRTGTTTVGDIEAVPELLPEMWKSTPLRVISFLEMIGITGRLPPAQLVKEALLKVRQLKHPRNRLGLSPHAPYSTLPELLKLSATAARRRKSLLATHVAESAVEFEMFTRGAGEMHQWLQRGGRDMSDCGRLSPVQHLEKCGILGSNLLAVHVNYLRRGDAALLARRSSSVVHCPRSHFYFRHGSFPIRPLMRAGVNICLGTDSLASVYKKRGEKIQLDMFAEMRALAQRESALAPRRILGMATLNGARALGMAGQIGALSPGAFADLIAIPFSGKPSDAYDAVVQNERPVSASLIDGAWAIPPESK